MNCVCTPVIYYMFKYVESPIEYKIDLLCVYQDFRDPKQKVGCLTPERPTKIWIEVHDELYKNDHDVSSLLFEYLMEHDAR